jgi:hypothetical protein
MFIFATDQKLSTRELMSYIMVCNHALRQKKYIYLNIFIILWSYLLDWPNHWRPTCLAWHALSDVAHTFFRVRQGKWMASEYYLICLVAELRCSLHAGYACPVGDRQKRLVAELLCSLLPCHPEMFFAFACWNARWIGLNLTVYILNIFYY